MNTNLHDILVKGKDLISDPERWTKGYAARDKKGIRVIAMSEDAVKWCMIGAIRKVVDEEEYSHELHMAQVLLRRHLPGNHRLLFEFNDDRATTHEDVMTLFDKAIEEEREKDRA